MAQVNSLKAGYINEPGVMSATPTSATSALIKHNVMLPGNTVTYLKNVAFTSAVSGDGFTGQLSVADGRQGTLYLTATAVQRITFGKVGGVIQVSGAASIPQGNNA